MATEEQELEHIVREIKNSTKASSSKEGKTMVLLTRAKRSSGRSRTFSRLVGCLSLKDMVRGYYLQKVAPSHILRLIAVPHDDVAFEAALDNDVILTAYRTRLRGTSDRDGRGVGEDTGGLEPGLRT